MAGHSAWSNIKHRKAKVDAARGKHWTKCARAIMVAARTGGPDPDANLGLRYAIDDARSYNMPKDTIQRAIDKGAGTGADAATFESVRYEGYGPCGVAVIADVLTDNRARTAPEMREIFNRAGGNLGTSGSVAYMFEARGVIALDKSAATEDRLMEIALDAGASDIAADGDSWIVTTEPTALMAVRHALENAGLAVAASELTMHPTVTTKVEGDDVAKVLKLLEKLEDNDDVQKVWCNFEASEADLARA
jgi:YebC/PmpR family DNA-binding regulatory protein